MLSLTFFFLVFSAAELAIGLALLVTQNIMTRGLTLNFSDQNFNKFSSRARLNLYLNKLY
jgi:hypothetical protein